MSRQAERITVYDVVGAATDEGEWVNGEFLAVIRNATAAQGKKPSKADLCDPDSPNIKIVGVWFGGDFCRLEGATCLFGGQGMKAKTYKGKAELTIGDKATVNVETAAPAGAARPASPAPAADTKRTAPGHAATPQEAAKHFHLRMKKTALLWLHAEQYAEDAWRKLPTGSPARSSDGLFQSLVSSLFITAKDHGLLEAPPALRDLDEAGNPKPFVPAPVAAPDPDAVAKAAAEAAEKARLAAEAEAKRKQEQLDEDVPF